MATLNTILVALDRRIPGAAERIDMVDAINIALSEIGYVTKVDETLAVVDNQTEYTLPSGVTDVVRVQIADSSTADYDYTTCFNWREVDGSLYFPSELGYDAGNTIRIYYNDIHDDVADDTDTVDDDIPIPLLVAIAAYRYEFIKYQDHSNISVKDESILTLLQNEMYASAGRYRVNRMHRDPILGGE